MSEAAATTTILFKRKIGAVSSTIISPNGDLVQYYNDTPTNPGKIYQDFTALQPLIYLVASSSRATENLDFAGSVDVYVNNQLLTFKDEFSTNSFNGETGHFKLSKSSKGKAYNDGITIVKNLVTAFEGNQVVIKIVGRLTDGGGTSDDISATYTIPVQKSTGSGHYVTIAAGDKNNFVITSKEGYASQCKLVAKVYNIEGDGTLVTEGLVYQWQIENENRWSDIEGAVSDNVTITESLVSSMANIRVIVSKDGNTIGMDIQTVRDNTDPMTIDLGASPKDETINEGSGGKVSYTPKLLFEGKEQSGYLFRFAARDSSGVPLNTAAGDVTGDPNLAATTTPRASFDVTEAMCEQAGGNVALSIFAVKKS